MRFRTAALSLPLVAVAFAPVAAQGTSFSYAPGTRHYRLVTEIHRQQVQGGGRAPFEFDVTTTQYATVKVERRTADTLDLAITLDSVAVKSDLDAPAPNTERFAGRTVRGLISPRGRVYAFDPPGGTTDPETVALYRSFRNFLAPFPDGPLAVGASWADTVTEKTQKGGFDILTRDVTTSTIAGDTTVQGARAWRVERHSTIAQSGEKLEQGGKVRLTGIGSVTGVRVVSSDGQFLGSRSTQRFEITMSMKDSEGAPITQTIKSTVERM